MKENKKLYRFLKVICTGLLKLLYRPTVLGKENIPDNEPVVFAGNHIMAIDPVVVMTSTDKMVHYMAKKEIFKGLHGKILEEIGIIKIDRSRNNPLAIQEAIVALENGSSIGIFPEGTRNKTKEELLKFKQGAVAIAKQANCRIIPFALKGKYKLFKKGIILEFGKPIDVSKMEIKEATEHLREEVLNLLRK